MQTLSSAAILILCKEKKVLNFSKLVQGWINYLERLFNIQEN